MASSSRRITKPFPFVLLSAGMVLLAVGLMTWLLWPRPEHCVRTGIHIAFEPPYLVVRPEIDRASNEAFVSEQPRLVRDRFVLTAALRDPKIALMSAVREQPDPLAWLEREIQVELTSQEFMYISVCGDAPKEQTMLLEAVAQSYLDHVTNSERNARIGVPHEKRARG